MELKDIAAVSGKPGLFKIVKPARSAMVLETLDEKKQKLIVTGNNRLSILKEISIYTNTKEGTVPLEEVFKNIYSAFKDALPVEPTSPEKDLYSFVEQIVPNYDREKVYLSDLKKLVTWYKTILKFAPEILVGTSENIAEEKK
jgi:hypothetical protein